MREVREKKEKVNRNHMCRIRDNQADVNVLLTIRKAKNNDWESYPEGELKSRVHDFKERQGRAVSWFPVFIPIFI